MKIFITELKRAVLNKWTFFAFLVTLVICFIPIPEKYNDMQIFYNANISQEHDSIVCTDTVFIHWLLYNRFDLVLYIFLFLMPILTTLPYGASYYNDMKNGYINQITSRCKFKTYLLAKYNATFISGGIVITLPLIIQFMLLSLIFPMYKPSRFASIVSCENTFCIDLFFEHPILHALMWCGIVFIVAGLFATLSLTISRFVYNYFGVILTPFVFSFILIFLTYVTGESELSFLYTISTCSSYDMNYSVLFIEIIGMFIISFFPFVFQKKEVL